MVLEAGQASGGDKRGKQSVALLVFHIEEFPYLDLRVDEHPRYEVARHQLLPFVKGLPSRGRSPNRLDRERSAARRLETFSFGPVTTGPARKGGAFFGLIRHAGQGGPSVPPSLELSAKAIRTVVSRLE